MHKCKRKRLNFMETGLIKPTEIKHFLKSMMIYIGSNYFSIFNLYLSKNNMIRLLERFQHNNILCWHSNNVVDEEYASVYEGEGEGPTS